MGHVRAVSQNLCSAQFIELHVVPCILRFTSPVKCLITLEIEDPHIAVIPMI